MMGKNFVLKLKKNKPHSKLRNQKDVYHYIAYLIYTELI
jgi:hypothetical protein